MENIKKIVQASEETINSKNLRGDELIGVEFKGYSKGMMICINDQYFFKWSNNLCGWMEPVIINNVKILPNGYDKLTDIIGMIICAGGSLYVFPNGHQLYRWLSV